jgi:site-specific DNA recombinase
MTYLAVSMLYITFVNRSGPELDWFFSVRIYLAIENGVIELDDDIKGRISSLKERRDVIEASLARIAQNIGADVQLDDDRIARFSELMQRKLDDGDVRTRKAYLSSVIDRIEVDDNAIRVFGRKDVLAAAIIGRSGTSGNVSGFVRKWRARQDSNLRPQA